MKKYLYKIIRKINVNNLIDTLNYTRKDSLLIYYYDYEINWGDSINEFIFESILGRPMFSANKIFNWRNQECITGIGSILNSKLKNYSIWGSGFLSEKHGLISPPNTVLAIRGELTRKRIKDLFGIDCQVMGDPGLLFKEFYNPVVDLEYPIGIIPHFKEMDEPIITSIINKYGADINVIDPRMDIFKFAEEVKKCKKILSSSLHGLILAESYNIPTARITLSNKIIGGDFKFMDYYSGVGVAFEKLSSHNLQALYESETFFSAQCDLKEISYSKENLILSLKDKF